MLTCVVSSGQNPLPAEVCIKNNREHPTEFFGLDQADWQYGNFTKAHYYRDPIQEAFQKVIGSSLIRTFDLFKYVFDAPSGKYLPHLDKPVDSCIETVIDIIREEIEKFIEYVEDEIENEKENKGTLETVREMNNTLCKLNSACAVVNVGHLARTILDTTHAFRANKNWNSHGSTAGAAVVHLGSILASLQHANTCDLKFEHMDLIPRGKAQTGAKHGNHHVSYVEYMCSNYETSCEFGISLLYLNHGEFRRKKNMVRKFWT